MKIDRLELYGFKRLMLNNIRHLILTPTSTHQLILGTNGSGKSSILSELSPLPGHSSNFSKDGYKKITISHLGRQYQLNSTFKTNKHNFLVDGEELNPGGTAEVQKALAFQHFRINNDIRELLTGEVRFSSLAAAERRKWITQISPADYGYAMGAYKRIASKARDQKGALNHLKARVTDEIHKLQNLQDVAGLEERSLKLREELNHLMLERIPNLPKLDVLKTRLTQLYNNLEEQASQYFRNLAYQPSGKRYRSNDDIAFDLQRLDTNLHSSQALLHRMGNEYSDMEAVVSSVQIEAGESLEGLPELIQNQLVELNRLSEAPSLFRELTNPTEIQRDWNAIAQDVQLTFRQLPDNADRRFTHDAVRNAQQQISEQQRVIDNSLAKINQMQARIEAMLEAKETQCPSCKYIWRPGFSEDELAQLEGWKIGHSNTVDQARAKNKDLEAFVEECSGYEGLYQRFRGFVRGYPRLQPLWDHILSNQLLLINPKGNLGLFVQWEQDLELNVRHEEGRQRLQHYREVQERQSSMGDTAIFTRRLHTLQLEIEEATQQLHHQRHERTHVERYAKKLQLLQDLALKMENDYNDIERIRAILIDSLRNEVIDETVMSHQIELGGIMRKLSEKEGQEGIVRDLEQSRASVELDAKALNLLVQALSPNEGLIAEQLSSDIGCLVAQLNSIIATIWTYDMTILSCGLDSGELDYKFPVLFSGSDNMSPDILKTSKGQRQIIDFAFQLTVMLYLNLTDYPLFLDEPGEGFDEQHRVKLMDFVKQLMEMNRHSQLFMISHYASGHGSFTNAEVLVLDSSNISVPGTYNQHAVLA
jgi:energy-coupling factor transporter ATP-binding protein EcfA2